LTAHRWLHEHRLYDELDTISDTEELDAVLDALESISDEPVDNDLVAPMQGTRDHVDRMIGLLPYG